MLLLKLEIIHFSDIYSYMNVLSKYKKGDAAKVKVLRGKEELTFDIIF